MATATTRESAVRIAATRLFCRDERHSTQPLHLHNPFPHRPFALTGFGESSRGDGSFPLVVPFLGSLRGEARETHALGGAGQQRGGEEHVAMRVLEASPRLELELREIVWHEAGVDHRSMAFLFFFESKNQGLSSPHSFSSQIIIRNNRLSLSCGYYC